MGALLLLFGILILFRTGVGALAIVLCISAYAFLFGISLLCPGIPVRRHQQVILQPT
jgi:uncharacterized membrane protein HdeD (DUF308 family)